MRRRMLVIVGLLLVVVAGVIFIAVKGLNIGGPRTTTTPTPVIQMTTVIFAAQDIPLGATITEDALIEGQWPSTVKMENLVTNKESIIGKRARINLRRGEPVLATSVSDSGQGLSEPGSLIGFKLTPGKVAIAVPMNRLSGVAYAIRSGDHVLIMASFVFTEYDEEFQAPMPNRILIIGRNAEGAIVGATTDSGRCVDNDETICDGYLGFYYIPSSPPRGRLVTAVLVSDARVLNVGNVGAEPAAQKPQAAGGQTTPAPVATQPPDVLVIEVTPEEALSINFTIRLRGDLTYALRAAGDTTVISLPSWDLARMMENRKIDPPGKVPYGPLQELTVPYIPVLGNDQVVEAR